MTSRNLISAIFISLHLGVILVLIYVFVPLLFRLVLAGIFSHGPETGGIVAVAGGLREWAVMILVVAGILFALVFILLQKRSRRS